MSGRQSATPSATRGSACVFVSVGASAPCTNGEGPASSLPHASRGARSSQAGLAAAAVPGASADSRERRLQRRARRSWPRA